MNIILVAVYVILTVLGLVLFKMGSNTELSFAIMNGNISLKFSSIMLLGLICYIFSFIVYMIVLTRFNLSYIFPITMGIVYILVFLASIFLFKEPFSVTSILGSIMVLAGVILLNVKK